MVAEEKAQLDFVAIAAELAPIIKENSVRINEERQTSLRCDLIFLSHLNFHSFPLQPHACPHPPTPDMS